MHTISGAQDQPILLTTPPPCQRAVRPRLPGPRTRSRCTAKARPDQDALAQRRRSQATPVLRLLCNSPESSSLLDHTSQRPQSHCLSRAVSHTLAAPARMSCGRLHSQRASNLIMRRLVLQGHGSQLAQSRGARCGLCRRPTHTQPRRAAVELDVEVRGAERRGFYGRGASRKRRLHLNGDELQRRR